MSEQSQKSEAAEGGSIEATSAEAGEIQVKESEQAPEKRHPLSSLSDIEHEVESAVERLFGGGWKRPFLWDMPSLPSLKETFEGKLPKVNIIDRDDEVIIEAELAGVKKEDIDVSVGDNTITIKATTMKETEESGEKGEFHRREISRGAFSRSLSLPGKVASSAAKANFEDGLLTVTLPKAEDAKRQTVDID